MKNRYLPLKISRKNDFDKNKTKNDLMAKNRKMENNNRNDTPFLLYLEQQKNEIHGEILQ